MAIILSAKAKINLGLDVVRRLENGYHEVRMVMQQLKLEDELEIESCSEGIQLSIDNARGLLADDSNLVYRAAAILKEMFNFPGVKIHLKKNIPMAAGLAGGSSDAAATLIGINQLFSLGLSVEELCETGVKLGADIPFCIMGGTRLSEGIGEKLSPLPAMPHCHILLAKPPVDVSTKYVYENLHVEKIKHHPNMDAVISALNNNDLSELSSSMENILETVTVRKYPEIDKIKSLMKENGALCALMSGSGPTVFGIFTDLDAARLSADRIGAASLSKEIFLTEPAGR